MEHELKLTQEKRARFCAILTDGSSVTAAARAIDVSRTSLYELRERDPEFAAMWDEAVEQGSDTLEDEAVKRAKDHSDVLLIFLLKGRRPEKFKDRVAAEHSGKVALSAGDYSAFNDDELQTLSDLFEKRLAQKRLPPPTAT